MKNKQKCNKNALTMIELLIALSIFSVAFFGILSVVVKSKQLTANSMITFSALQYAQSLLEIIQAYPYEDPSFPKPLDPDNPAHGTAVFGLHDETFAGGFDAANSGVYDELNPGVIIRTLTEDQIGLKYYPTSLPASPTPLNPFERSTTSQSNSFICGPEDDDPNFDSANGIYIISSQQLSRSIFGLNSLTGEPSDSLAKYYFMDDVDDFDGYREVRELLPGIPVTFDISVMSVYNNTVDYPVIFDAVNTSITQARYSIMQPISEAAFPDGINFSVATNPQLELRKHAVGYYNQTLFKKITIRASWAYPRDSTKIKTIIIDGGKVNPKGLA